LCEAVAQVGGNGVKQFLTGIKFLVNNAYVYLTKGGGYNHYMLGGGVVLEAAALVSSGSIMGMSFNLWLVPNEIAKNTKQK
jgi:hypothetical protein